jgi:hypothetical protein
VATAEHWTEAADGHDRPTEDYLSHHLNEDADIPLPARRHVAWLTP